MILHILLFRTVLSHAKMKLAVEQLTLNCSTTDLKHSVALPRSKEILTVASGAVEEIFLLENDVEQSCKIISNVVFFTLKCPFGDQKQCI